LIEQATVDCNDEDEQLTGLYTMVDEHLAVPFTARVLGVEAQVREIEMTGRDIVAVCVRDGFQQRIGILELPLPNPLPDGAQWVDAYRRWAGEE
jgi:hypothetical protein